MLTSSIALLEVCKKVPSDLPAFLTEISETVEHTMDGTSGALYSIFLNALTTYVKTKSRSPEEVNVKFWTDALDYAVETLGRYTPAQRGDRTLVDALHPFLNTLHSTGNVQTAAKASLEGAEETKGMTAKLGRAVYVGEAHEWVGKIPDPGAWGLSNFLLGLAGVQGVEGEC
jgi:dihydroxyacetone kinase